MGVIGRRLTGLRRLALAAARQLSEAAMQHISGAACRAGGCTTCAVCLSCFYWGPLLPGPCTDVHSPLRRLACFSGLTALTELSITDAHDFGGRALEALRPLAMLRRLRLTEPSLNPVALGAVLDDEEGSGLPLLPALTYLELHNCRLLRCAAAGPCCALRPCVVMNRNLSISCP